jgi:hypothetical protein
MAAWHEGGFDNSWGHPCASTGNNSTRVFRRAYYAAVSFTDSNIGKLLHTVKSLGLFNNTVVALMGVSQHYLSVKVDYHPVAPPTADQPSASRLSAGSWLAARRDERVAEDDGGWGLAFQAGLHFQPRRLP